MEKEETKTHKKMNEYAQDIFKFTKVFERLEAVNWEIDATDFKTEEGFQS